MSHHSERPMYEDMGSLRERLSQLGLGATGQYPHGKLCESDEGEIKIAIASDPSKGVIIMDFGKRVRSIGFTAQEAEEIEETLAKHRMKLRGIDT